ncbi:MAG: hypothetical protein A3G81_11695 [Betaproteobacteria bacterium RIFCSPLOWO2_12_FULL_65_14]|nr:MAG: hypothetical protein A3G81_11695 [Betaproteobacteria bacterium RIFCSPLOWO2_12_FULL_65_14]
MSLEETLLICAAFFAVAMLYSSVGQAGASGYLAILALGGLAPDVMRPTALTINMLASAVTVYRFRRAKLFSWSALWPFLAGSLPLAAVGGAISLARGPYYAVVGSLLIAASLYMAWRTLRGTFPEKHTPVRARPMPAAFTGGMIGLLSGLTGIGGGIFLSPLLLFLGWADAKAAMGVSAPFILANSAVALAAGSLTVQTLPPELPLLAASAVAGALAGTWLGIEKLNARALLLILALVLAMAGSRLLVVAWPSVA